MIILQLPTRKQSRCLGLSCDEFATEMSNVLVQSGRNEHFDASIKSTVLQKRPPVSVEEFFRGDGI